MELICQDFHFYNNGIYRSISKHSPDGWFNDLEKVEPSIRIFGTKKQIDEALDTYIELTGMNLNEVYNYKVEKKGDYYYDLGIITDKDNKVIKKNLILYKEKYNKLSNNKALITTI
tara:strand:- start:2285 stop:2632 length:348 start_codon:yes stop_codon:yes gene_type:complete